MAKLRKMLGDIQSEECIQLMRLIETQSKTTLAAWAVAYAKSSYLGIYEAQNKTDQRLLHAVHACEEYLAGDKKLAEIKPFLREAAQAARDQANDPAASAAVCAAARAVSVACATVQTPTNALGFLFYGAAAVAYDKEGTAQEESVYDALAAMELRRAYASLQQAAVPDEPFPAKINWNC